MFQFSLLYAVDLSVSFSIAITKFKGISPLSLLLSSGFPPAGENDGVEGGC